MHIDINQKKIALGDKYEIFLDGKQVWKASSELFRLLSVINLYTLEKPVDPVITIRKEWFFFKPKYRIEIHKSHRDCQFRADSWWNLHYQCYAGSDDYHIYGQKGRKHSVYRNGKQVAWWDKEAVTWFEGDNYHITTDSDADHPLIIAFCLIIDNHKSKNRDSKGLTFDPGNIGKVVKPFNPNWRPS